MSRPSDKTAAAPPLQGNWHRQDEDVQLMLRLRDGDRAAFDQLVERNTPKVHALVFRFLGEPSQVEDLTQEVFLRVFRTAKRYQPTAKFSTWLYRIAANLSFNVMRSRRKGLVRPLSVPDGADGEDLSQEVPAVNTQPPHEHMDGEELRQKVAEAISQLPENQRVAIVLNKFEQKSYDEISQVLGCSTMAVKSLLSRARANLHVALKRYVSGG